MKHDVRKLKDIDIMPKYKKETIKLITQSNKQQNKRNEEINETKSENLKQVVRRVASKASGYEERHKRNDWYDEQCQIKVKKKELNPELKC
jgi:hypothetical protein